MSKRLMIIVTLLLPIIAQTGFTKNETTPSALSGRFFTLSYLGNALSFTTKTPAWFYQFAGVSSLTSGFSFLNCTPSDNGFCLFSASDTVPGVATLRGPAVQPNLKLCLNGVGNTYSCERFTMGDRFAYVTNNNTTISLCPINSTNGAFGPCSNLTPTNLSANPRFMTLNHSGTLAYIGSFTFVSLCPINIDGTLGSCSNLTGNGTFNGPFSIALNNAGSIAYVVNYASNTASLCPVNTDGSFGTCSTSTGNGTFNGPVEIALNNSGSIAYVTNFGGGSGTTVSVCPVNADGSFGTCSTSTGNGTFNGPVGIALNNSGSIAYVTNYGSGGGSGTTVSVCPVNADGSFGTCSTSTGNGTFNGPTGITLNNEGSIAYVANFAGGTTVSLCSINANGSFGTCSTSTGNGTFNNPAGIALF